MSIRGMLMAIRGGVKASRFSKAVEVEVENQYPIILEETFEPKEAKPKKDKVAKPKKEKAVKSTKNK